MRNTDEEKKKQIKTLAIYGAVLFLVAMLILSMAIMSQMKLDKSKSEYQEQINSVIEKYSASQEQASETISSLSESLNDINKHLEEKQKAIDDLKLDSDEAKNLLSSNMEELSRVTSLFAQYLSEDYKGCYNTVKSMKKSDTENSSLYASVKAQCAKKISEELYNEGCALYENGNYKEAMDRFKQVSDYISSGETYDNTLCLMLLTCDASGDIDSFNTLCAFVLQNKPDLFENEKLDDIREKIILTLTPARTTDVTTEDVTE
jgi:tetratricopeptide (TPR) repeat protein